MLKRKLISFDWAIKKLLRSKANFGILEGFLSELLFSDIKIIEVLESETDKEDKENKLNRVDIKVKDSKNHIILIEVQYSRELDFLQRILFETSKSIAEHLKENAPYSDVTKIISVNILYFDFCQGDDYIYHGTTTFVGMHKKTILQLKEAQKKLFQKEKVSDIYPEYYLIHVKNFDDVAKDTLDEWIYFLKNEEIKDDFKAKGLVEAKEKFDVLKMSPAEKVAYELHQKALHREASLYESTYILGKGEGREKGREEGREEERLKQEKLREDERNKNYKKIVTLAKELLKSKMSIDKVSTLTGLSIEELKKLKQ